MSAATWTLSESYTDAAMRTYLAALCLQGMGDLETSGHLFGVAAECAVKAKIESVSVPITRSNKLKVHFPELIDGITFNGHNRHMAALLPIIQGPPQRMENYSIHSRYAAEGNIDAAVCAEWADDAKFLLLAMGFLA